MEDVVRLSFRTPSNDASLHQSFKVHLVRTHDLSTNPISLSVHYRSPSLASLPPAFADPSHRTSLLPTTARSTRRLLLSKSYTYLSARFFLSLPVFALLTAPTYLRPVSDALLPPAAPLSVRTRYPIAKDVMTKSVLYFYFLLREKREDAVERGGTASDVGCLEAQEMERND